MLRISVAAISFLIFLPSTAVAFSEIRDQADFVDFLSGKTLRRLGISLNVAPTGNISGRAFGRSVTGSWIWSDGFFCRELYFGTRNLGPNCQLIQVDGKTVRFISDRGTGPYADFKVD